MPLAVLHGFHLTTLTKAMLLTDIFFAGVFALILAGILTATFGRGPAHWPGFLFLFLILVSFIWAGGMWVIPIGPPLWGTYWLSFLIVGFIVALLIAAMMPPARPGSGGRQPWARTRTAGRSGVDAADGLDPFEEKEPVARTVGLFFWVLITALAIVIVSGYAW